eukprot:364821-Chlamydomonas_euryale.AAC.2
MKHNPPALSQLCSLHTCFFHNEQPSIPTSSTQKPVRRADAEIARAKGSTPPKEVLDAIAAGPGPSAEQVAAAAAAAGIRDTALVPASAGNGHGDGSGEGASADQASGAGAGAGVGGSAAAAAAPLSRWSITGGDARKLPVLVADSGDGGSGGGVTGTIAAIY